MATRDNSSNLSQSRGTSHTESSPKLTINHLPDELLIEIFDFYRQESERWTAQWSTEPEWFVLVHVCKRWRAVMFESASRLDLRLVLTAQRGGDFEPILAHVPPLPIDMDYYYKRSGLNLHHVSDALEHPDRFRQITFRGPDRDLNELLYAIEYPLPALESLDLVAEGDIDLDMPAMFLEGPNLQLRSLQLNGISLPSISRLLSSAPALNDLTLSFECNVHPEQAMSHLSHLQDMPCLRHLGLSLTSSCFPRNLPPPTKTPKRFTLPKLTSFSYYGHGAFLITFISRFATLSLRDVKIQVLDDIDSPVLRLSRFIEDIREHCHAVQVVIERFNFRLLLRGPLEDDSDEGHDSLYFKLTTVPFRDSMMQISSPFSAMLITTEELSFRFVDDQVVEVIPWREFLMQFPSVKLLRIYGNNNRGIASALNQARALHQDYGGHGLTFLPALEEIELGTDSPQGRESELATFRPFVSARQQAGLPVKVVANMRTWYECINYR